jgi:glycosyltransferase involved in cell wall biosynthesis
MFLSANHRVVIQCFTDQDHAFISKLNSNLLPIKLGPADWVDPDKFAGASNQTKVYDLVMVANWARHKQHRQLFNALRKIRNREVHVLLIGFEWGGRTKEDILREAAGLKSHLIRLEILENISQHEIAQYLLQSKVYVYLSKKEGDNKAVVEGFLCDVPAIVYKDTIGGIRARVNKNTGIFTSYEELHETIVYMLDHYQDFSPREWALNNIDGRLRPVISNTFLKDLAKANGEPFTRDIVGN